MRAAKLALLAGVVAAAALAVLLLQRDDRAADGAGPDESPRAVAASDAGAPPARRAEDASPGISPPVQPTGLRPADTELRARSAEESYARVGDLFVDHLAARGLARRDAELVVRRFFDDNSRCLFDALRLQADAQRVDYDSVLDAVEADLYDTDGPLLMALLDMRAVEERTMRCSLTAAQQAGLEPATFSEEMRAAIIRRAR